MLGDERTAARQPQNLIIPHGFQADYTIGFVRGLAANGVPLLVVSSDPIVENLRRHSIPHSNLRGSQDPRRPLWAKAWNLVRYYRRLFATIYRYRGATIHFAGLFPNRVLLFDGLVLGLWMRFWARRYVYTAHNTLPHGRRQSWFFRAAYWCIYRLPHAIVVHTPAAARRLQDEFAVGPSRLRVISIGLNEEVPNTALTATQARDRVGVARAERLALFFGNLRPYKGADLLVQAWEHVRTPGARLIIAGQCPDAVYASRIRHLIASSPHDPAIEWREGFVADDAVEIWLKAAEVVVLPYREIEQSSVIFLCLRFGVPIVASDVGSMAELVDARAGVLARSNDPVGIAEAIDRLFAESPRFQRDEIIRLGEKYRWDHVCRALLPLYQMPETAGATTLAAPRGSEPAQRTGNLPGPGDSC